MAAVSLRQVLVSHGPKEIFRGAPAWILMDLCLQYNKQRKLHIRSANVEILISVVVMALACAFRMVAVQQMVDSQARNLFRALTLLGRTSGIGYAYFRALIILPALAVAFDWVTLGFLTWLRPLIITPWTTRLLVGPPWMSLRFARTHFSIAGGSFGGGDASGNVEIAAIMAGAGVRAWNVLPAFLAQSLALKVVKLVI